MPRKSYYTFPTNLTELLAQPKFHRYTVVYKLEYIKSKVQCYYHS